ncbi:MAG: respiratory nitrate reductase subunit gamma [Promethearchaeota archaeon]
MTTDPISYIIMGILPYIAITCFVIGVMYKMSIWIRSPPALNRFTVFPGISSQRKYAVELTKEITFFPRIWKVDKKLWIGAWLLHYGLLMTLIGHTRLLFEWQLLWDLLGFNNDTRDTVALISGSLAGIIVLSAVLYLLGRRLSGTMAEMSNLEDYFVLALFLGIGFTGMWMRLLVDHIELQDFRDYLFDIFTLQSPSVYPDVGSIFLIHLLLVLLAVAIIPYTKLFHLGGVFVTMRLSKLHLKES